MRRKKVPFVFDKQYEAHHLVCVSAVTNKLLSRSTIIKPVIKQTKWCINNKDNMLAMPLWGHTVKWYCSITAADVKVKNPLRKIKGKVPAPPFQNIPQHNWDHIGNECYLWEVEEEVDKLADDVESSPHQLKGKKLEDRLKTLSTNFKNKLVAKKGGRGWRKGGTDAAWGLAQKPTPDPEWCHPFSMASNGKVTSKGFPARDFGEELTKWIERIAKAIAGP